MKPPRANSHTTRRARLLYGFLLACFGFAFSEALLRISNLPNSFARSGALRTDELVELDDELGWKHRPGSHSLVSLSQGAHGANPFLVTYWPDRLRATRMDMGNSQGVEVLLSGCSFVEGYGLADQETFAWKLQALLPEARTSNGGVAGYGTLQSYLAIKQHLRENRSEGRTLVVYGFADFHAIRNIKNPLHHFYTTPSRRFPYCDEAGCRSWEGRFRGGIRKFSRVVALIEDAIDSAYLLYQRELARKVTIRLLREMSTVVSDNGGKLVIAPVSLDDMSWLTEFNQAGIPVVMCDSETLHGNEYRMDDGHPNARWTDDFSRCLAKGIRPFVTQLENLGPPAL